jgi:methionyl-tRNA formyltransferase
MNVVFFGTPVFAAKILEDLVNHGVNIIALVTKPDKRRGRSSKLQPSAVKEYALEHLPNIPLYQPTKISAEEYCEPLRQLNADLFIVVAFGEIIKQHLLDLPKKGCVNIHASLLPKYRGAAPIQQAIIEGEATSGITIIDMVKKMDAGTMIKQTSIPIPLQMTAGDLEEELCSLSCKTILEVIREFEAGSVKRTAQDESLVTFAPKIEAEHCEVKWDRSANEMHNLIRGVTPRPGAWSYVTVKGEKKRTKLQSSVLLADRSGEAGEILEVNEDGVVIACAKGALLIKELKLEGKRMMKAAELFRGIGEEALSFRI